MRADALHIYYRAKHGYSSGYKQGAKQSMTLEGFGNGRNIGL